MFVDLGVSSARWSAVSRWNGRLTAEDVRLHDSTAMIDGIAGYG